MIQTLNKEGKIDTNFDYGLWKQNSDNKSIKEAVRIKNVNNPEGDISGGRYLEVSFDKFDEVAI